MQHVNAEIIAIGTEILLGEITDTNSVYIARLLRDLGINLYYMTSVGDNEGRITNAIQLGLSRADVVITCGGLGPTIDDMTRQGVADATGRKLVFHTELLEQIAARFATFRATMTENNKRQAYLPEGAIVIENPVGTAPSFIVEHEGRVVISLPGVPREMKFLLNEKVVPYLKDKFQLGTDVIKARVLRTAGLGESMLDSQLGDALLNISNPSIGLAAHTGQVDVRITAKAASEAEAYAMIAPIEAEVREKIGEYIFGADDDQLQDVLLKVLQARGAQLALVEAGMGSPVQAFLMKAKGWDGLFSQNGAETPAQVAERLGVAADGVLRELAEHAARHAAAGEGVGAAIAVLSNPQATGEHADSSGNTAVAVCCGGKVRSRLFGFGQDAEVANEWVASWGLAMAWRMLTEE